LIELITTKGQDELIERMRQWNSHVETYPWYALDDFFTILKDVESALTTNPDKLAQFKTFLEENEKMISHKVTKGFLNACAHGMCPGGYMVNPKDNGKYHRLVVDHLRDSPHSESWQKELLASVDELKSYYWNDLIETNDSWVENIRKKSFSCCIMALEFVEVVEFDPPGGCLEDPLDLVDFGSEVELVGKYDVQIRGRYKSDKILVIEKGLTVLKDYRQRKIGTRLVRHAEEFIKSQFRTRTIGGPTKIYFLVHCDNKKSLSLFKKRGYDVVNKDSKNVQDFKTDFKTGNPEDELSVSVLKETTA
jgi:GNAT superfamily N-acetyltransferase